MKTIPLDKLYNHLDHISQMDKIIYLFNTHGSRNLEDCLPLRDYTESWAELMSQPIMICHDQEPLNWARYQSPESTIRAVNTVLHSHPEKPLELLDLLTARNLRSCVRQLSNINDTVLLLHSDFGGRDLDIYEQNGYQGVFFWSHAIIARDWYRHASSDPALNANPTKLFNVYNRDWTGSREYRLWFTEQLIERQLVDNVQSWFNPENYHGHTFENLIWQTTRPDLEEYFPRTTATSDASADYSANEYNNIAIDVVLETLVDDRVHLTEKVLRAIACGKPFMLASGANSLDFLKRYGFETFHPFINESYDNETDPVLRLSKLLDEMEHIAQQPDAVRQATIEAMNDIARRNQQIFFSDQFFNQVIEEYQTNLEQAYHIVEQNKQGKLAREYRQTCAKYPTLNHHVFSPRVDRTSEDQRRLFGSIT